MTDHPNSHSSALRRFRWRRCRLAGATGFTLIEVVLALMLFLIVATALAGTLASAASVHQISRERTIAEEAALDQLEYIRRLNYDSVGVTGGNPSGVVPATKAITAVGLKATLTTQIQYVNDPLPTSYATYANYKRVVITITRNSDSKQLARQETLVSPPARAPYGGINLAIINTQVIDYALNTPLVGATVNLATGPSAPRSDTTDATGTVTFAALDPNPASGPTAYYDLTASAGAPYQTLFEDLPANGTAAHVQLAPAQTFSTSLRLYKPATITVTVNNTPPATTTYYVGVGGYGGASPRSRAMSVFSRTGTGGADTFTVTTLGSPTEMVVPNLQYKVAAWTLNASPTPTAQRRRYAPLVVQTVPNDYPTDLTSSYSLTMGSQLASSAVKTLTVQVRTTSGGAVPSARVDVAGATGPYYITGTANGSGNVTFTLPSGSGYNYTIQAWGTGGITGTGTVTLTSNTTKTVTVS